MTRILGSDRRTTRLIAGAVLLVTAMLAAACGSGGSGGNQTDGQTSGTLAPDVTVTPAGEVKTGNKLVYGVEAETSGFDPTNDRWAASGVLIAYAIYDPLAAYDADGNLRPYLAESFTPNDNFTKWTIKVRPNITFHNGSPLNGAAVAGALNAIRASTLAGGALRNVTDVTVPSSDPMSVVVTMRNPWASFPAVLVAQAGVVPAPEQLNATGEAKSRQPIGTGPFVFRQWIPDKSFVASRNPNYWMRDAEGRQLPYLNEVEFRPIPDVQTRVSALESRDVNMMHTTDTLTIAQLKRKAELGEIQVVQDRGENEETFVMFNTSKPPFDNVTARRAVAYAVDYESYRNTFEIPPELAADSAFGKGSPYYVDSGFPTYDPERARQLVQQYEAETGEKLTFTLGTTPVPVNQQAATLIAGFCEAVGMKVSVQATEQGKFIADAVTGNYQANLWRQFSSIDPDGDYVWWHESNVTDPISLNIARFKNRELSEALDKARASNDPAVRKEQYAIVQRIWADQVPYVWLTTTTWVIAAENDVRNLGNVALPDAQGVANIPSIPFQSGTSRLTMTWVDR
ncbi:MAG: ABC transporter substrate-binding protein [Acidimicrobiales bacterium]